MAITRICQLGFSDQRLMVGSAVVIVGLSIVGGAAMGDFASGIVSPLFAAGSAVTGSGLVMDEHWTLMSYRLHAVLMPLAIVGGLGLPTLLELYDRVVRCRPITRYSKLVIVAVAASYAVGMLLLLATMGRESGTWDVRIAKASVLSITAHGPGLPIVEIADLARPAQWIMIGLMLTGGVPASGAAGIGLPTLAILVLGLRRALRDERPGRIFGIAAAWTITYLLLSGVVILLLLASQPQLPADRAILLAVSAAACVGLSHDAVSITGPGLYVLSIAMLVGRFAPIAALWWIAIRRTESDISLISQEI
jgi:Trk-type K+ transport system membrane component